MENKNIITKEGLEHLKKELKNLIEIERPKVIEDIKDARALGDLSENAEFDVAREKQGHIENRILEIESIIKNSSIIKVKTNNIINIGSMVEYEDLSNNKLNTVTIVGTLEADPFKNKISNSSPLGIALIGAQENDEIIIQVNEKYKIKVIKIKK